jgi:tRNA pseudouridine32 synthase/23S rRNA pseudouridine746 synthase
VAKNHEAASIFGELFREHKVTKYYIAIAGNKPNKKQGAIRGDIVKGRRGAWKLEQALTNPSLTQFLSYSLVPGKRLYILKPHTGKTHQLRVVMKSLSVPILGDSLYSGEASDRTYLHAYGLKFEFKGKEYSYQNKPIEGELFKDIDKKLIEIGELDGLNWPRV